MYKYFTVKIIYSLFCSHMEARFCHIIKNHALVNHNYDIKR